ncbi:ComF family protein [Microscilla marina]|uniref:Competence protein n=1 Tax=Microscilla marina ATCC 23134 TaxID=313606 RepID=A1ZWT9_MICM2|nr:ComF family protein [Microscilla marina]EAY25116.1 competence protein [Microscilla marina ATCC 23134]
MLKKLENTWLADFFSLIFPNYCLGCEAPLTKGEKQLCTRCLYDLPQTNYHLHKDNVLSQRFWGRVPIEYAFAYLKFSKGGKVQKILHELKYDHNQTIGEMVGNWYGQLLIDAALAKLDGKQEQIFDLILPVPLHKAKLRSRGYNQSDCFARGLSAITDIPWYANVLRRNKATKTQTKKGRIDRWKNVDNIFEVLRPELVKGQHVLLVDDVVTTGATLEACANSLLKVGTAKVSVATIAVAL